ncbi:methionine/alanine import family NSS transporter small subunit [Cumulibacter soli]|nr:methionine/alanine import family NSS transporter small subunit [Cumulibacter soli]
MSASAVVMLLVSIVLVWGGFLLAVIHLMRSGNHELDGND